MRWRLGIYLGCATNSNECYVANVDGDVLKSRSVARVVADARWDADAIQKVKGMPGKLIGHSIAHAEFEHLEEHLDPHVDADAADRNHADVEESEVKKKVDELRINMQDLRLYGYHPGPCPRCEDIQRGVKRSFKHHSAECRNRVYQAIIDAKDPRHKYLLTKGQTQDPEVAEDLKLSMDATAAVAAPPTPVPDQPLRNSIAQPDEPNDYSGAWNPEAYHASPDPDMNEDDVADMFMDDDDGGLEAADFEFNDGRMMD